MIVGNRITISEPFPHDRLTDMYGWLQQTKTITSSSEFPPDVATFCSAMEKELPNMRSWGVIDNISGLLCGCIILERDGGHGYNGYVAARRRCWGKGLMEEAVHLMMDTVFQDNGTQYITGLVAANNAPAVAFNARVGMTLRSIEPKYVSQGGVLKDLLVFETTRDQWQTRR